MSEHKHEVNHSLHLHICFDGEVQLDNEMVSTNEADLDAVLNTIANALEVHLKSREAMAP